MRRHLPLVWLACIAISAALTLWQRGRSAAGQNHDLGSPNTFAVYLIHPLVLVPITYALSFIALPALAKFGLAWAATVIICYTLADFAGCLEQKLSYKKNKKTKNGSGRPGG